MAKSILFLALLVCLVACGGGRDGGPAPVPAPGPDLISMGRIFIWVGGISIVVGIFAKLAMAVGSANPIIGAVNRIPGLSSILSLIPEFGICSLICGVCFHWLGSNLWVMVASLVVSGLLYCVYRRNHIRRWLQSWKKG